MKNYIKSATMPQRRCYP